MDQIETFKLLIGILCCVMVTGLDDPGSSSVTPKQNILSPEIEQLSSTQRPISTTGHPQAVTGSSISLAGVYRKSTTPFACADGLMHIDGKSLCNGRGDCPDSSDENSQLCNGTSCMSAFPCLNGKCIEFNSFCNGSNDCDDSSDESALICWPSAVSKVITCANGQVLVDVNIVCNRIYNCMDKSDEMNCTNCPGGLSCDLGFKCIKSNAICDRIQDCEDGADESCLIPDNQKCGVGNFICPTGKCVTTDKIMSDDTCWGSQLPSHEDNLKYCNNPHLLCDNGNKCIRPGLKCDGHSDCLDGSDEMGPSKNIVNGSSFACTNGFCVSSPVVCNGINDCGDNSDESGLACTSSDSCKAYKCPLGYCIPYSSVCDGINDCLDNSDETGWTCLGPVCKSHACPSGQCILFSDLCNGKDDCGDGSDEITCLQTTTFKDQATGHCAPLAVLVAAIIGWLCLV